MSLWSHLADKCLKRRAFILGVLLALPFPILVGRVYYLQTLVGEKYKNLARRNRVRLRPVRPVRGEIVDRHGAVLAQDAPAFRLVMVREQCDDPKGVLERLKTIIHLSEGVVSRTLKEAYRRAPFTPVTVKRHLSFEELAKVQVNKPVLSGLDFKEVLLRDYGLYGTSLSHLVGYVGRTDDYRVDKAGVKGWAPDFPVGRQGLEKLYEDSLGGVPGFLEVEHDANGRALAELARIDAQKGAPLKLTLDMKLHTYVFERIGQDVGSVVVMDVSSGAVLAAVSKPGFDPNDFSEGIDRSSWNALLAHPDNPLLNRSMQGLYSPGSTFKLVVAHAALEEGLVTLDEKIRCRGKTKLGRRDFHCWKKHGVVDFVSAIAGSCDIYFYEMAKRLGPEKIAEYAKAFGLGEVSGIGLPEKKGILPTPTWKWRTRKERWSMGETYNYGIGQGFLLTTPLQMCTMCARLATGKKVSPVLLKEKEKKGFDPLDVKVDLLQHAQQGMFDVVNNSRTGTAKSARRKGFTLAGKTGTVQVVSRRIEEGVKMSSVPKKQRPHGMFIGYAPYDNPKFAVAVVVENGGSGSGAAAPIAADVLAEAMAAYAKGELV